MSFRASVCVILTGWLLVASVPASQAQSARGLDDIYIEAGYVQAVNAFTVGDQGVSGMGFRYYEHHCCLARSLATLTVGLFTTAAAVITGASQIKNQTVEVEEDQFSRTTTTTTTYYSEEEKAERRERAAQNAEVATSFISNWKLDMEVIYFPQQDDGKLHGLQLTVYLVEFFESRSFRFQAGVHYDSLGGRAEDPRSGMDREMRYKNVGVPLRLVYRPVDWIQADAEFRLNFAGTDEYEFGDNRNQGLRSSLTVQPPYKDLDRFYGRITGQSNNGFEVGKAGLLLELGLRL